MITWPFFLSLFLIVSAGEIDDGGDFQVETTDERVEDFNNGVNTNTTGDKSGLEPTFPLNPDFANPYDPLGGAGTIQCPSIRYRNKCYYAALSQESWYTGRDYCQRIGQTLVRIESSDEATFLASYLYEGRQNNYWVNLQDEKTEGVWTTADLQPSFVDWWAPGEPNGNRAENCGLLVIGQDRIGRLVDDPCGEWRRYICERRVDSACRRAGYQSKCYWFSSQKLSWFGAREYCASMGQRLARVTSMDESNFLARVMPRSSWIDLRSGGQGVGWTMSDGTAALSGLFIGTMMAEWAGPRCAELRRYNTKEGRAFAVECAVPKNFICESGTLPAGSETVVPEELPGSLAGVPVQERPPYPPGAMIGAMPPPQIPLGMGMGMLG